MQKLNDLRIAACVIVAHAILIVVMAFQLTIGVDETFTLATTSQGPVHAVEKSISFELQPPLYFAVLSVWRTAHTSLFHARLFSVLCSTISLIVLLRFVRQSVPDISSWPVIVLAAFSPVMIYAAVEARCYAMVILISCVLLKLFFDAFVTPAPKPTSRIAFTLVAVASLYTFYFLGFVLAAGGVALVFARKWRMAGYYLVSMTCVATCFAPLGTLLGDTVDSHTTTVESTPELVDAIRLVTWRLRNMVLPVDWSPFDRLARPAWVVLTVGCVMAVIKRRHSVANSWTSGAVVGFGFAVACFVAATQVLGDTLLAERHFAPILIPTVIFAAYFVDLAGGSKALKCFSCLALVGMFTTTATRYPHFAKSGDWHLAAELLTRHEQEEQPVVVFTPPAARAVAHYYNGLNDLIPLPHPQTSDLYAPETFQFKSDSDVDECFRTRVPDHDSIWIILDGENFEARGFGAEHLKTFVSRNYFIELSFPLHGSRLLKCRRKTQYASLRQEHLREAQR